MHYHALLIPLILVFSFEASAFMNIESIRQAAKPGTSGNLGLKVNGQTGNADKQAVEFSSLTMRRTDRNELLGAAKYRYGESRHRKDANEGNLHARYTRYLAAPYAIETFVQSEFDEFRRLERRDLAGAGLRTLLDKGEKNSLYLGTGVFYEHEIFKDGVLSQQTVRGNLYLSFVRSFSEHISGTLIAYYQPSFESQADFRIQVDSGLQVKLVGALSLTIEYDLQHDSEPAPGVKPTDSSYMTGLAYSY